MDEIESAVGTPSPGTDAGISTPAAAAPGGNEGNVVATPVEPSAPQQADVQQVAQSEDPLARYGIPADDTDLEGRDYEPGVKGLRQTREHIRSLVGELREVRQTYEGLTPLQERAQKLGGIEAAAQALDLAEGLFAPAVDANGQTIVDPQTGVPLTTTRPFLDGLFQASPFTFASLIEEAVQMQLADGSTIGETLLKDLYGLDPSKLELYRAINSPEGLSKFAQSPVDESDLAFIPQPLHDAFKSLTDSQRADLLEATPESREHFLEAIRRDQEYQRHFAEAQKQQEQQRIEAERQRHVQMVQQGEQYAQSLIDVQATAIRQELTKQGISNEDADDLILLVRTKAERDPQIAQVFQNLEQNCIAAAQWKAANETLRARQFEQKATEQALFLGAKVRALLASRTPGWVGRPGDTNSPSRPVIAGGSVPQSAQRPSTAAPFSPESLQSIANSIKPASFG